MNVLIDYHHSDLMNSLHALFEDRLGMTVYTPRGLEWRDEGYWRFGSVYPDGGLGVAQQFLLAAERDSLQPEREIHWLPLDAAQEMDFAVVVATVPENYDGYARFAREKGARFVIQVGNANQPVDHSLGALILDASGKFPNAIHFTPEFDMDGAFAYNLREAKNLRRTAGSFVNLFPRLPCYPVFEEVQRQLPRTWFIPVYGHGAMFLKPASYLGKVMGELSFVWHDKSTGDGFGYVIHYAASVGRPLIGHASHYRGQVAEDLWEDGVTCIDLDKHTPQETANLMEAIVADPEQHQRMSSEIATRVRSRINFDLDAQRVADALGMLVPA